MKLELLLLISAVALVQSPAQTHEPAHEAGKPGSHERGSHERPSDFEAEFLASPIFRSGSYVQPLWKGLSFEGHYFGGHGTDVGFTGGAWAFHVGKLKLSPGLGVLFGNDQLGAVPMASLRWDYERRWFVTQGLTLQGLRETEVTEAHTGGHSTSHSAATKTVRPAIADGSHVSVRWNRLTLGGTWERIHFREVEWLGGGRLAVRILPRVSALVYVLAPGKTEWRWGVLVHPPQED